jgi:hypothetical protein
MKESLRLAQTYRRQTGSRGLICSNGNGTSTGYWLLAGGKVLLGCFRVLSCLLALAKKNFFVRASAS